jgi:hypothetical protein
VVFVQFYPTLLLKNANFLAPRIDVDCFSDLLGLYNQMEGERGEDHDLCCDTLPFVRSFVRSFVDSTKAGSKR